MLLSLPVFLIFHAAIINLVQGLTCYDCNIAQDPTCLQRNPTTLVHCQKTDIGCVIFESSVDPPDGDTEPMPYQIGTKRCICQSEIDCIAEQGITTLTEGVCVQGRYSWELHDACLTEGLSLPQLPVENDRRPKSKLCLCRGDRCNSKEAYQGDGFTIVEHVSVENLEEGDEGEGIGRDGESNSGVFLNGESCIICLAIFYIAEIRFMFK